MSRVVLAERESNLEFYIPTTPFKTSSYLPRRETVIINRSMLLGEFLSVFFCYSQDRVPEAYIQVVLFLMCLNDLVSKTVK